MGNQWVEKHRGGEACVVSHEERSAAQKVRRGQVVGRGVRSRDNLQLQFSALSGAVRRGDTHPPPPPSVSSL